MDCFLIRRRTHQIKLWGGLWRWFPSSTWRGRRWRTGGANQYINIDHSLYQRRIQKNFELELEWSPYHPPAIAVYFIMWRESPSESGNGQWSQLAGWFWCRCLDDMHFNGHGRITFLNKCYDLIIRWTNTWSRLAGSTSQARLIVNGNHVEPLTEIKWSVLKIILRAMNTNAGWNYQFKKYTYGYGKSPNRLIMFSAS